MLLTKKLLKPNNALLYDGAIFLDIAENHYKKSVNGNCKSKIKDFLKLRVDSLLTAFVYLFIILFL